MKKRKTQWQPVATAPQDGTTILYRDGTDSLPELVYFSEDWDAWCEARHRNQVIIKDDGEWCPIPEAEGDQ